MLSSPSKNPSGCEVDGESRGPLFTGPKRVFSALDFTFSKEDLRTIDREGDLRHLRDRKAFVRPSDQSKPRVTEGRRATGLTAESAEPPEDFFWRLFLSDKFRDFADM